MIPSVTEIISPWAKFDRVPPDVLAAAAARGTAVHDICFGIARGTWTSAPPELSGYVASFITWMDAQVDAFIRIEDRLVDPGFHFHGEPDLIVRLKDTRIALVDLKTPAQGQRTWRLQNAGYRLLCAANGIVVDQAGSLMLDKEGRAPKMIWSQDTTMDQTVFLQALNVYRWMKGD